MCLKWKELCSVLRQMFTVYVYKVNWVKAKLPISFGAHKDNNDNDNNNNKEMIIIIVFRNWLLLTHSNDVDVLLAGPLHAYSDIL